MKNELSVKQSHLDRPTPVDTPLTGLGAESAAGAQLRRTSEPFAVGFDKV